MAWDVPPVRMRAGVQRRQDLRRRCPADWTPLVRQALAWPTPAASAGSGPQPPHATAGAQALLADTCPRCGGTLLPPTAAAGLPEAPSPAASAAGPAGRSPAALVASLGPYLGQDSSDRPCAACGGATAARQGLGSRIDACLACGAAWVYRGGLGALPAGAGLDASGRAPAPTGARRDSGRAAGGALARLVGRLVLRRKP